MYPRFDGSPALSIVTILTELSLLHHRTCLTYKKWRHLIAYEWKINVFTIWTKIHVVETL